MIMALLYAPDDFALAQTIVCTSGWDTDCNAGNVGCLMGAMLGLEGIEPAKWRGPLADRMLISSADGGDAINDAVRVSARLVDLGRKLADLPPLAAPKNGAQFHFSFQGSMQGFMLVLTIVRRYLGSRTFPSTAVVRWNCGSPGLGSSRPP